MTSRYLALTLALSLGALGVSCTSADEPDTATETAASPTTTEATTVRDIVGPRCRLRVGSDRRAGDVDPKEGYDEVQWDSAAQFIWGDDLEVDNTVLLRTRWRRPDGDPQRRV